MELKKIILPLVMVASFMVHSQENETKAFYHGKISSVEYIPSIISRPNDVLSPDDSKLKGKDKRSSLLGSRVVIGKDPQTQNDYYVMNRHEMEQSVKRTPPSLVFDTFSKDSDAVTDPSLAVGPNHVFVVYNTGFMIYDKEGNQLLGETAPNPAIFPSGGCCDLTVSYDNAADRWVISFLGINGDTTQLAISDGSNPLTSGWYVYNLPDVFDYQKLSVWSDGYYITDNGLRNLWVLERSAMLTGDPEAQVIGFDLNGIVSNRFIGTQAFNVTDDNLPAPGGATIVYLQDDAWEGVSEDHIKLWTADVDWENPENSTISDPQQINTAPFINVFDNGDIANLSQPEGGGAIDALQAAIMNQAQFRKFATHNSAVFNFVVDTDAGPGKLAGIRWYEFRQSGDNQPWSLYQEGTYAAPDGRHAWMASLAMDKNGNIGMGYTSMSGPTTSTTTRVSSYYTGRLSSDPLGTMTSSEELIANGTANIVGARYGDYSKIDVDPSDDSSFWFITEYMNSGRKGVVGKFQIEAGTTDTEAPTAPTNLIASNITPSGATLNWTASTDNVAVTGYTISIDGTVVGASQTTTFSVTGLSPATSYNVSVSAQDAAGNVSGAATVSFTTITNDITYCDSASRNASEEYISNVQLNTIYNTSTGQTYSDFTSVSTNLNEGKTYTVSVTPTWVGTIYSEGYAVWIDYNNNGSFDDAGELVWSKPTSRDTANSGSFTVPVGTSQTSVRMRVSMRYSGVPTSCETFSYGEVEDYTVNLAGRGVINDNTKALKTFAENVKRNIKMYPNPANSELTIDIKEGDFDEIKILSSTGAMVKNISPKIGSNVIDVSQFTTGVYFVRFTSKRLAVTERFIKQ
ncbi:GEVED domain-containing protein [Aquimarina sp. 2201CG1-2-11]|uniref:GEVED domain-containing protein n=1 Tax=Aquimarina discodermiae TaxID=3231043 RepID=UPI003462AF2D